MRFTIAGTTYDTTQMTEFETGNPAVPSIFLTADARHVFVQTMNKWTGVGIHEADAEEIQALVARYGIADLRRALPRPPDDSSHKAGTGLA